MRLLVRHRTEFSYLVPASGLAQLLRMTPLESEAQRIVAWSVRGARGRELPGFRDGFGNFTHLQTCLEPHLRATVEVEGVVETLDRAGLVGAAYEPLPPGFFLHPTPLTAPDAGLVALAGELMGTVDPLARLHALLDRVGQRLAYRSGVTGVQTSAAEALRGRAGVCQDFAHVFVAAARLLGHPARYVGGYLHVNAAPERELASHAWAEAWLPDLGWVGFDASAGICPTERYVRTGVGRDYADAAPVRGVRRGSAGQRMQVSVQVAEVAVQ